MFISNKKSDFISMSIKDWQRFNWYTKKISMELIAGTIIIIIMRVQK